MTGPNVQVLLGDDYGNFAYDITQYVDLQAGISINRGRQDEFGDIQASTCSLTLDNTDGRFTPPGHASKNLLPNGSFEVGVGAWTVRSGCTIATTTAVAASGTRSLALTATSTGWPMDVLSQSLVAQAGQTLTAQAQFRAATTSQLCDVVIYAYNSSGGVITSFSSGNVTDSPSGWVQATVTATMPAGTATVQVMPEVVNAAANEVHYVDAVMIELGSTASPYEDYIPPIRVSLPIRVNTTVGSTTYTRFTGSVTSWPVEWPGGNNYTQMQITASDRMADLARQPLRSVVEQTVMPMNPSAYYTLGEPTGSTSAGDTSGNGWSSLTVQQRGTGGSVGFGQGTGPGTDSMPAVAFAPVDANNGQYLSATFPGGGIATASFRVVANTSTASAQTFAAIEENNGPGIAGPGYAIGTDATGHAQVRWYYSGGVGNNATLTGSTVVSDGLTHDFVLTFTPNSSGDGNFDLALYVDNKQVASLADQNINGQPFPETLYIGGQPSSAGTTLATATISHVAIFPPPNPLTASQISNLWHSVSDGFTADRSDQRIARYASWIGLPSSAQALDTGVLTSVAHQDTTNMSVLDAMKNVATAEGGVLYVNHLGQVTFQARNHRYGAASKATLHADDIGQDTSFQFDTQGLINTVTATRPGGATQTVTNSTSVSKYGPYPQSLSLLTTSDADALNAATWMSALHSEPYARISATTVDLLTQPDSFVQSMLALSLGDRISLTGMPSQAPSESDLNVEGWAETIGANAWSMNLNTSRLTSVFTIEDPTYGSIGTTNRLAY